MVEQSSSIQAATAFAVISLMFRRNSLMGRGLGREVISPHHTMGADSRSAELNLDRVSDAGRAFVS
jgi:hypothetical protein